MVGLALALGVTGSAAAAQPPARGRRVSVAGVSLAYIGAALIGARIAIRDSLPEAPFGMRSHRNVRSEFLAGTGTALSPGLSMLVAQGVATAMLAGSPSMARGASHAPELASERRGERAVANRADDPFSAGATVTSFQRAVAR